MKSRIFALIAPVVLVLCASAALSDQLVSHALRVAKVEQ